MRSAGALCPRHGDEEVRWCHDGNISAALHVQQVTVAGHHVLRSTCKSALKHLVAVRVIRYNVQLVAEETVQEDLLPLRGELVHHLDHLLI